MTTATAKGAVNAIVINVSTNGSVLMTGLLSLPFPPFSNRRLRRRRSIHSKRERDYRQNANDDYAIVQSQGLHNEVPKRNSPNGGIINNLGRWKPSLVSRSDP